MAGIYSQGGSAGHRYAGWLSKVEAKNFHFGGKVFNGSPSAIYVGSKMVWSKWLNHAAFQAIMDAFGVTDGTAVIRATNEYLLGIAASDMDKATALASYINEDPMMVCSLGLEPTLTTLSGMPVRYMVGDGNGTFKTGIQYTYGQGKELVVGLCSINYNNTGYPVIFGSHEYHSLPLSQDSGCVYSRANTSGYTVAWYDCKNTPVIVHLFDRDAYIEGGYRAQRNANPSLNQGNGEIQIGKVNNNTSHAAKYWFFKQLSATSELEHWFVPYKDGNSTNFMDLVTGNYATKVGTWQEKFYLPDGTEWTPPTP